MKASLIKLALKSLIAAKQPVYLWGAPGIGKSDVVRQVAKDAGLHLKDVRAILLDPVDLRGIPHINGDGRAHWCPPDFLPRDSQGILFLDELNAAPQSVQAACYQLILDRRLGEYELPAGWSIIAAGNRETDRAVTNRMPTPLANRFVHLDYEVNIDDWVKWALSAGIMTEVIAFIRFRPNLLHAFEPQSKDKAFPSPRSWEFVSRILKAQPDSAIEYELIKGTVGEGAAAELLGFLRIYRQLPAPDSVLMNPDGAPVPDDPAALYALCGALARRASDNTMNNLVKYAKRLPAEFSVLMMRDCTTYNPAVVNTRAFIEWSSENSAVLM